MNADPVSTSFLVEVDVESTMDLLSMEIPWSIIWRHSAPRVTQPFKTMEMRQQKVSEYSIRPGLALIRRGESDWFIQDETERKVVMAPVASALLGLLRQGPTDEDSLVAALAARFGAEKVYYSLAVLEKQGLIVSGARPPFSMAEVFRNKVRGKQWSAEPAASADKAALDIRILAIGGTEATADDLALSLSRSEELRVHREPDWHRADTPSESVWVLVTPDFLEPDFETFGRFAFDRQLRWFPVKAGGVQPILGPLFIPGTTGCVECLLDRLRGHHLLEMGHILEGDKDRKSVV